MAGKRYAALIGIVLFLYILWSFDIGKILAVLAASNLALIAAAGFLSLASGVLKGLRWNLILKAHGIHMPNRKSIEYFFSGFFVSMLTPARVGELVRAVYAKPYSGSVSKALPTVVIDRLIDVAFLIALAFVAVLGFAYFFGTVIVPFEIMLALAAAFVIAVFVLLKRNATGFALKPFFNIVVPASFREKAKDSFAKFYDSLENAKKNPRLLALSGVLTLCAWVVSILVTYAILLGVGIASVPFIYVIILLPILSLLDLLPISISGIGTRDAAAIFLLSFYAVPAEYAVAFSIMILAAGYMFSFVLGALLFWREPVKMEMLKS